MNDNSSFKSGAQKNLIFGTNSATRGAYYHNMGLSSNASYGRIGILEGLRRTSLFEKIWYPIFIIAGILCLIFVRPFTFELCFAVISLWLGMLSNNLLARGKWLGLLLSIISSVLYTTVCFFTKVFGEVIINIILYIPLDIFALITFKKNISKKSDELEVKVMRLKQWLIALLLTLVLGGAIFAALYFLPGQIYPLLNASSVALFISAMLIRNLRYKEFWWFNLFGNLMSVIMWAIVATSSSDLLYSLPFALSSLAALSNNVFGIVMWQSIYKKSVTNGRVFVKTNKVKVNKVIKLRRRYKDALRWEQAVEEKRYNKQQAMLAKRGLVNLKDNNQAKENQKVDKNGD